MERKALVELDGSLYIFPNTKAAGIFLQALEHAEGVTKNTWGKERKPVRSDFKVEMRLSTREDIFVPCCQRCQSTYTPPEEGEKNCPNCLEELRKEDFPCTGTIPETDDEEAHTCTNVVSMLPEKAEEVGLDNILCYSCRKREED